jgi:hypothetical protein
MGAIDKGLLMGAQHRTELDDPRNKSYGHCYVSSFELKVSGGESAALHCLWGLEDGSWKILAWKVISD